MYYGEGETALDPIQGSRVSSRVDLGYTKKFHIPLGHQCHSRLRRMFLGTLWSSIKQIKAAYVFDCKHGIALHVMKGNRAWSLAEREVSWFFSSCGGNLCYVLDLRRGWPFKICVCSGTSGLLSSSDGYLRNLN